MNNDGVACLTVWGRRENSIKFCIIDLALANLGREVKSTGPSNFDIGSNIE